MPEILLSLSCFFSTSVYRYALAIHRLKIADADVVVVLHCDRCHRVIFQGVDYHSEVLSSDDVPEEVCSDSSAILEVGKFRICHWVLLPLSHPQLRFCSWVCRSLMTWLFLGNLGNDLYFWC